jgi:transcriptional regulator with XRE-family HTH domain
MGFVVAFKDKLLALRDSRRLTKTQLAKDLGTTRQLISAYENGVTVPTITMFEIMADYFGVSADYLLDREFRDQRTIVLPAEFKNHHVSMMSEFAEILLKHTPKT